MVALLVGLLLEVVGGDLQTVKVGTRAVAPPSVAIGQVS